MREEIDNEITKIKITNDEIINGTVTEIFNVFLEGSFLKKMEFTIIKYEIITLMPELKRDGRENLPLKRKLTDDNLYKLYISEKLFLDDQKLNLVLKYELLFQLFSNNFIYEEDASNVAFSIIWDIQQNPKIKQLYYTIWRRIHPPYQVTPYFVSYLAGYVAVISKRKKHHYSKLFFEKYNFYIKEKLTINFAFQVAIPTFADFSNKDLEILRAIIIHNTKKIFSLSEYTGFSHGTISMSVNRLQNTYMFVNKIKYSPSNFGFQSVVGILTTKRGAGEAIYNFNYSLTHLITIFKGSHDVIYINFYIPDTYYARSKLFDWLVHCTKENHDIKLSLVDEPLFGFEIEEYKLLIQRPELYNFDTKEWEISHEDNNFNYPSNSSFGKIDLNQHQRKIILELLNFPHTKKTLIEKMGRNKTKISDDFNYIESSGIISREYVMPFYLDLTKILVIYDGSKYYNFINKAASKVPLSVNSVFEIPSKIKTLLTPRHDIGYSFLSVPPKHLNIIMRKIINIDRNAKILFFPKNLSSSSILKANPTDSGWEFMKIPPISFKKLYEGHE